MDDLLARLHTVLSQNIAISTEECGSLLLSWIQHCDRSAQPDQGKMFNDMHVAGMAICSAFQHATFDRSTYDLADVLGQFVDRIVLTDVNIGDMSWQQVADVIATLQIEFSSLFEPRGEGGFRCSVKMQRLIIELMARLGFFLSHNWKVDDGRDDSSSMEVVHGIVNVDSEGWRSMRADSVVQVLDGLHAITCGSWLILSARRIPPQQDTIDLQSWHREASLDDFYEISTIADTPLGAVTNYSHKFRHLFHSTSQVVGVSVCLYLSLF